MLLYIFLAITTLAALYFCARYLLLKQSLKSIDIELNEVIQNIDQNRIVKLPRPNQELEHLLQTINKSLDEMRKQVRLSSQREEDLKTQIEHISHDLRTPLTSILGYLSLLERESLSSEDKKSLEIIQGKARSLQKLIAQFYDLSRLQGNDYTLVSEKLDVGRLLRESVLSHHHLLSLHSLSVTLAIPDNPVFLYADRTVLERVFANLLENASRYAKSMLDVALVAQGGRILISFTNDASSLDDARVKEFFTPFYASDSSRNQEGSGLGLTISRYLVESLGGSLDAVLEEDKTNGQLLKFSLSFEG